MPSPPRFASFPDSSSKPSLARESTSLITTFESFPELAASTSRVRERDEQDRAERKERRRKEARRQKERELASALVKGEKRKHRDQGDSLRAATKAEKWGSDNGLSDGVPWYEISAKGKARPGYEEPFDAVGPAVRLLHVVADLGLLSCPAELSSQTVLATKTPLYMVARHLIQHHDTIGMAVSTAPRCFP